MISWWWSSTIYVLICPYNNHIAIFDYHCHCMFRGTVCYCPWLGKKWSFLMVGGHTAVTICMAAVDDWYRYLFVCRSELRILLSNKHCHIPWSSLISMIIVPQLSEIATKYRMLWRLMTSANAVVLEM